MCEPQLLSVVVCIGAAAFSGYFRLQAHRDLQAAERMARRRRSTPLEWATRANPTARGPTPPDAA